MLRRLFIFLEKQGANNVKLENELSRLLERCTLDVAKAKTKLSDFKVKLAASKNENHIL
jgi:hypothetical protein